MIQEEVGNLAILLQVAKETMDIFLLQALKRGKHLMFPKVNIGFIPKRTFWRWLRITAFGLEMTEILSRARKDF